MILWALASWHCSPSEQVRFLRLFMYFPSFFLGFKVLRCVCSCGSLVEVVLRDMVPGGKDGSPVGVCWSCTATCLKSPAAHKLSRGIRATMIACDAVPCL